MGALDLVNRKEYTVPVNRKGELIQGYDELPSWAGGFLKELATHAVVSRAAERACPGGVTRCTAYNWKRYNQQFSDLWDEAIEQATDLLELKAVDRALNKGSDTLLMFLLRAKRPQTYDRARKIELSGQMTGQITVNHISDARDRFLARFLPDPLDLEARSVSDELDLADSDETPLLDEPHAFTP